MEEHKVYRSKKPNKNRADPAVKAVVTYYNGQIEAAFKATLTKCLPSLFMANFKDTVCAWSPYDLEDYVRAFYVTTGCVQPKDFCDHFRELIRRRMPEFDVLSFLTGEDLDANIVYERVCEAENNVIALVDISRTFDTAMFTALATRLTEEKRRVVFVFASRHSIKEMEADSYLRLGVRSFNANVYSCKSMHVLLKEELKRLPLTPPAINKHLDYFERSHRSCKILQSRLRMDIIKYAHLDQATQIDRLLWKLRLDLNDLTTPWENLFRLYRLDYLSKLLNRLNDDFRAIKYERFVFIEDVVNEFMGARGENLEEFIELFCLYVPKKWGDLESKERAIQVSTNYIVPYPFDYEDASNNTGHSLLYSILKDLSETSKRVNLDEAYNAYSAGYASLDVPDKIRHHDPKYHFQVILDTLVYRGVVEMDPNRADEAVFVPQPSFSLVSKMVAENNRI
uniref:KAP NTPase domain-containing protein n=1 Tax=Panagrellus redivivus TaxID=6233 RepID=A0A7E4UXZ6_PANRE